MLDHWTNLINSSIQKSCVNKYTRNYTNWRWGYMGKLKKKSHLIKGGKIVVYKTDQYELTQLSLGRYGEIRISSVQGIAVHTYSRCLICSAISDWYKRLLTLRLLNLHAPFRYR